MPEPDVQELSALGADCGHLQAGADVVIPIAVVRVAWATWLVYFVIRTGECCMEREPPLRSHFKAPLLGPSKPQLLLSADTHSEAFSIYRQPAPHPTPTSICLSKTAGTPDPKSTDTSIQIIPLS